MELTVKERFLLLSVLPAENDYLTMKIVRQLQNDVGFSEDEHGKLNFRQSAGGRTEWNAVDLMKEIDIGPRSQVMIADLLKAMSKAKKLTADHLLLYERFVPEDERS